MCNVSLQTVECAIHDNLAIAAHILITEHCVVRIGACQVSVLTLFSVSILYEVANELVAKFLRRLHSLSEEVVD